MAIGIENTSKIVKDSALIANSGVKIVNKGGLLSELVNLIGPLSDLSTVDFKAVAAEIKDLSGDERLALEKILSETFNPGVPALDKGLDDILALAEKCVKVAEKAVVDGKALYEQVKLILDEIKLFAGA